MPMTELPAQWKRSESSLRAVQLVFEFSKAVSNLIREEANLNGLSTSDQIRSIIGLPVKPPKRPRLSVSLSAKDYLILGARYGFSPDNQSAIRQAIAEEIIRYAKERATDPS